MHNIMLDIETTDNRPTAAVLQIAAVVFTPTEIIETREWFCELQPQLDVGRTVGATTLQWWMTRASDEAREKAFKKHDRMKSYSDAYRELVDLCWKYSQKDSPVSVWGNGSDFDNVVLRSCAKSFGIERAWHYRGNRCYRTLVGVLDPQKVHYEAPSLAHDAVQDAIAQALHLATLQELYPTLNILHSVPDPQTHELRD